MRGVPILGQTSDMDDDPWRVDAPPAVAVDDLAPLPPRLAELAALTGSREVARGEEHEVRPRAAELPEIQDLVREGWRPLDEVGTWPDLLAQILAVWPAEHRCWVPDRLPRVRIWCLMTRQDGHHHCVQQGNEEMPERATALFDPAEEESDFAATAARYALPAPPAGRLWLLRSPWPSLAFDVVRYMIERQALEIQRRAFENGDDSTAEPVTRAVGEMMSWNEEQLWDRWEGPHAEAAAGWRRVGRVGDEAADVVLAGLRPSDIAALTGDGAGGVLTEEQAVAWAHAVGATGDEAVLRIRAWRALGLPADPPEGLGRMDEDMTPDAVAEWLQAGFGFDDVATLSGLPLERALPWREAGFSSDEVHELLRADWTLTPEEASAFTDTGITGKARIRWLEAGFDAGDARAWTDLDVLPNEARVWRSLGKSPADARPHRDVGGGPLPPDIEVGWVSTGGGRGNMSYQVRDPEGTRGRYAHEARARRGR